MEDTYSAGMHVSAQESPLPIGAAALHIGVSIDTLRRWSDDGRVAFSRTLGGQRRYEVEELERVKAEMRAAS